jgi:hypothetical protein
MLVLDLLTEMSVPRTLYHGTLKEFLPDIFDFSLLPQVGAFVQSAYREYAEEGIPLDSVTFAADRRSIGKCVSAIIGQMRHRYPKFNPFSPNSTITANDFFDHGAVLVLKKAEFRFQKMTPDLIATGAHPPQAEPDDYYHRGADYPDFVLQDSKLEAFLRAQGVDLSRYGIVDWRMQRAERIRSQKSGENN